MYLRIWLDSAKGSRRDIPDSHCNHSGFFFSTIIIIGLLLNVHSHKGQIGYIFLLILHITSYNKTTGNLPANIVRHCMPEFNPVALIRMFGRRVWHSIDGFIITAFFIFDLLAHIGNRSGNGKNKRTAFFQHTIAFLENRMYTGYIEKRCRVYNKMKGLILKP